MTRNTRRRLLLGAFALVGGLLLSAAGWSVFRYGVESRGSDLPALGKIPNFSLVASDGRTLTQADLVGKVWVADFIFTRCGSICPTLSQQMAKLQKQLEHQGDGDVRLVSISVDPTYDTPEVLRAYGDRFGADHSRWWFATGKRDALHSLISKGFHLAVAERPERENTDGEGLITHSDRFVLIDRDLNIRAYYHGSEPDSVQRILKDAQRLDADS